MLKRQLESINSAAIYRIGLATAIRWVHRVRQTGVEQLAVRHLSLRRVPLLPAAERRSEIQYLLALGIALSLSLALKFITYKHFVFTDDAAIVASQNILAAGSRARAGQPPLSVTEVIELP
jgi:hypothetical protein